MIYEKLRTLPRSEFPIVSFKISVTGSRLKFNIRLCEQLSQIIVDFVINVSGSILVMQLDFVGIPVELVLPTQAQFISAVSRNGNRTDTTVVADTLERDERTDRHILYTVSGCITERSRNRPVGYPESLTIIHFSLEEIVMSPALTMLFVINGKVLRSPFWFTEIVVVLSMFSIAFVP